MYARFLYESAPCAMMTLQDCPLSDLGAARLEQRADGSSGLLLRSSHQTVKHDEVTLSASYV